MRISAKFRWFILILVVLVSLSVALVAYLGNSIVISGFQEETLKKRSLLEVDRLQLAFAELTHDIRFIESLPALDRLVRLDRATATPNAAREAKDDLANIFYQMLRAKPDYSQIRLIRHLDNGLETVRVDQRDGEIYRVADKQLQSKADRDYYNEARQRRSGEIYYSAINLNREHGVVELPIRPVLRVAMPVYDAHDSFYGIVIINLNFNSFIQRVLRSGVDRSRYDYYLLNATGGYLYHPQPGRSFAFDLGIDAGVEHEFEELEDFVGSDSDSITFRMDAMPNAASRLVHFTKFEVFDPPQQLVFGMVGTYDDIGRASIYITLAVIFAMCLLTGLALVIAMWLSSQITRPIELITRATKNFANGGGDCELPRERSDEIGDLARTFLEMKAAIEKQQHHLRVANERLSEMNRDLEHFARVASHDLREPIQRIAGLASLYSAECMQGEGEGADELLSELQEECGKATRQLADFREFTDITKDASLELETCRVGEIIRSVLDEFTEALEQRHVQVSIPVQPELKAYRSLLRVLYRNLVENALQHTEEDGFALTFTVSDDPRANVVLGVLNTGSTIAECDLRQVFNIFSHSAGQQQGTGLGLAVCKRIVAYHFGQIWIESDSGHVHVKFRLGEP